MDGGAATIQVRSPSAFWAPALRRVGRIILTRAERLTHIVPSLQQTSVVKGVCPKAMAESVAELRARWTPNRVAAATQYLQGVPCDQTFPQVEQDGIMYTDLRGVSISQAQFVGTVLDHVSLRWSSFHDVGFKDAVMKTCNLSHTSFDECYMRRAQLLGCNLINARFTTCDFSGARLAQSRLEFAVFTSCEIRLDNVLFRTDTSPIQLERVCRNLKLNAMSMGHHSDASNLAYLEKTYGRHAQYLEAFARSNQHLLPRLRQILNWLLSVLLNWIWGYGEKPGRLILTIVFNIMAFGTLQYWLGGIPADGWWEAVYFSGITFLTIGYGDLAPAGFWPRALSILEGVAGISVLGLLIASATKKIMYR